MYNRDNPIMRKLLRRPPLDTTPDTSTPASSNIRIADTSTPSLHAPNYRSNKSQDAVYPAGVPIACLDASPDRRTAILGGRHILKTINIDGATISEGFDVRSVISSQPQGAKAQGSSVSSLSDQLSIKDVKWQGDSNIFTACSNGRIFSYDLAHFGSGSDPESEFIQMREDSRQVNTLDVNPHRGTYLLSGSQDGIVRCFDIRVPHRSWNGGLTFEAKQAYKCNADGVQHVKWSPTEGFYFACGTESGVIMKWDLRKHTSPVLRLAAHDKACSSIAWHPDGTHIMSAGWDSRCHVWNMASDADKRQRPKHTISTPAPVGTIAWRPGLWSVSAQGKRVAQVAVSYDDSSQKRYGTSAVHVWDLARPTMPFKEIERFDAPPASIFWKDQDLLWTAGRDGIFAQCDVAFAPKVLDRQSLSSVAFSPRGDVMMFLDERPDALRPRPTPQPPTMNTTTPQRDRGASQYGSSASAPILSISRSDSEEDAVGSFVGPRRRIHRAHHRRSSRAGGPGTVTPSAPTPPGGDTLTLDQSLKVTGMFKTQQAMAFGHVPASTNVEVYRYLSRRYLDILERELPPRRGDGRTLIDRVSAVMEGYARAAEGARMFRLAQTWRILSYVVKMLLVRRGQYHLERRLGITPTSQKKDNPVKARELTALPKRTEETGEEPPRKPSDGSAAGGLRTESRNRSMRSLLAEEIESTSNQPTPVARPADDPAPPALPTPDDFVPGKRLTPVIEPESFTLGPAAHPGFPSSGSPRKRLDSASISVHGSNGSVQTHQSNTEGYDFYDTEALAMAIDVPRRRAGKEGEAGAVGVQRSYGPQTPSTRAGGLRSENSYGFSASESAGTRVSASEAPLKMMTGQRAVIDTARDGAASKVAASEAASEAAESEYNSRIRGQELGEDSPKKEAASARATRRQPPAKAAPPVPNSPEEIFLISQTTMETDPYSQGSATSQFPSQQSDLDARRYYESRRAEGKDSPERKAATNNNSNTKSIKFAPPSLTKEESRFVTENDYLPWPHDPAYPHPLAGSTTNSAAVPAPTYKNGIMPGLGCPIDPYTAIARAVEFECRTSALSASAMVLLLRPLVSDEVINGFRAVAILRQHHSRLMGMRHFVEAAHLRNLCVRGWPGDILAAAGKTGAGRGGDGEKETVAAAAADGGLLTTWGEDYPSIFGPAQQNVKVAFYCATCRKPRDVDPLEGPKGIWKCKRCKQYTAPCAVCGHRESPGGDLAAAPSSFFPQEDDPSGKPGTKEEKGEKGEKGALGTWWYCPGCAHGGHASCLAAWHDDDDAEGCCPLDGCGHACLPGRYRSESSVVRAEELGRYVVEKGERGKAGRAAAAAPAAAAAASGGASGGGAGLAGSPGVRSDGNDVPLSRAVESVREALGREAGGGLGGVAGAGAGGTGAGGGGGGGGGTASPGRNRERRKSVKFAGGTS